MPSRIGPFVGSAASTRGGLGRRLLGVAAAGVLILLLNLAWATATDASAGVTIDANVSTHETSSASSIASPSFSTTAANELLVAYLGSDGPNGGGSQSFSSVTGAGLTWTLRQRTNTQAGDAEIWAAVAPSRLTNVTVTAKRSRGSYQGSIEVVSYIGANTALVGATAGQSGSSGAPTISLTTTQANSWVWAVGDDWDNDVARAVPSGQTLANQYLDTSTGDTYWAQYANAQSQPAGTKVTLNDTAPTQDRWNMAAIEILPASAYAAPTVAITVQPASPTNSTSASFSFAGSDPSDPGASLTYLCSLDGATPSTCTSPQPYSSLSAGTHHFSVTTTDNTDGLSSSAATASWVIDTTPPTVAITAPANNATVSGSTALTATATDSVGVTSVQFQLNGTSLGPAITSAPYSYTWNTTSTSGGSYTLTAKATDAAGNTAVSSPITIVVNNAAPTVAITVQPASPTNSTSASFSFAGSDPSDPGASLTYLCSLDGATPSTCTSPQPYSSLSAGTHHFSVTTTDNTDGLSSSAATASWVIDTTPPTVAITAPANNATVSGSTALTATATDSVGVTSVQFQLNGTSLGPAITSAPYSYTWNTTSTSGGSYTLTAKATDAAGNTAVSSPITVVVNNAAPTGTLLLGNQTVQSNPDSSAAGAAEAFDYSAVTSGQAKSVSLYVDTGSTATQLSVGIYSNSTNGPGTLLASGTLQSPAAGAWDAVNVTSGTSIASGTSYWLAVLGSGGTLDYRDATTGSCSQSESSSSLASLPATWASGASWPTCTLSAFVAGTSAAPSVPANLAAGAFSNTSVELTWSPSTDSTGILAGYDIFRNGTQIATVAASNNVHTTHYIDTGLAANTPYTYTVSAYDTAGNASAQSSPATATTQDNTGNVIFSDSFSGTTLSPAWTVISRHGEYAQNETECNVPQDVSQDNMLTITTVAQSTTCGDFNLDGSVRHTPQNWPYATGDIQWTSFDFTYGTVSYRAKFPPSNTGTWPAVWLLGANCQATNIVTADVGYSSCAQLFTPGYVESDLTECDLTNWCQLATAQPSAFPVCGYPMDTNWHNFTFTWNTAGIYEAVDGKTACSFTAAAGYTIPSTPMFLIIQTQTGGAGGTPNNANLPAQFEVSNVTVTQP